MLDDLIDSIAALRDGSRPVLSPHHQLLVSIHVSKYLTEMYPDQDQIEMGCDLDGIRRVLEKHYTYLMLKSADNRCDYLGARLYEFPGMQRYLLPLRRAGILTVRDLTNTTREEICSIRGIGRSCIKRIDEEILQPAGLNYRRDD